MFGILFWEACFHMASGPPHEITTSKNIRFLSSSMVLQLQHQLEHIGYFNKFIEPPFLLNPWEVGWEPKQPSHISFYLITRYCCRISLPTNYLSLVLSSIVRLSGMCPPEDATRCELKPLLCRGVGFHCPNGRSEARQAYERRNR